MRINSYIVGVRADVIAIRKSRKYRDTTLLTVCFSLFIHTECTSFFLLSWTVYLCGDSKKIPNFAPKIV
jgi:hypothetical protein